MARPARAEKFDDPDRVGLRAETAYARQLFLYGNGDGKRVVGVTSIAKLSGICEATVRNWLPKWEKEYEEMLIGSNPSALAISLSEADLKIHRNAMQTLSEQMQQCQWELEKFDEITAMLEEIVRNFSLNTDNGDQAVRLLENYLTSRGAKSSLRSQFLALQKQWATLSGIVDLKDIQTAAAKALETGRAKLKLKGEGAEVVRDVTPAAGAANLLRG